MPVYVMEGRDSPEKVKIGIARTPALVEQRRLALMTGQGSPMTVLHILEGHLPEERALHMRFANSNVAGTKEWFYRTPEVREWLGSLDPHVEPTPRETALQWLARVKSPRAKAAIDEWHRLVNYGEEIGSCSHTLWDMLAGAKGKREPLFGRTLIRLKGRLFVFPVFQEACIRQGTLPPPGSEQARVRPKSHRTPQAKRWGTKLRATQ